MKDNIPQAVRLDGPSVDHTSQPDPVPVLQVDLSAWMATAALEPATQPGEGVQPQELVLSASRKIVLQCGLSSITLHANGKIELRGQSIVSAAEGINRLSGGQIELN